MSFKLPPSPTCGRHWFKITSGRNIFCCHTCIASEFLLREGEEWLWLIQDSTFRAFATEGSATASLPGGLPASNHACGRFLPGRGGAGGQDVSPFGKTLLRQDSRIGQGGRDLAQKRDMEGWAWIGRECRVKGLDL